ncbi:hypothetical protein [Caulobacter sp.]|uniref:hypothetical protein n=1 Tax=Caulobacter sp. TaxID=78 RepID=UPI001B1F62DC|nr:hypothetical protein [Caulobacter sp.]MBO9543919.1 hypothetical protein [Caulobacter sp.]
MGLFRRRRLVVIAALSLALHALVLAWLAWPTQPNLFVSGPDLSLMSVKLMRPSAPKPVRARSEASRTEHRVAATPPTIAATEAVAPVLAGVAPVHTPASPPAPGVNLRAALQASASCTRATSRQAREACAEKLGRLAPGAPSYDAPMDPGKRAYYDAVVAAGPSGKTYGDPKPMGANPDGDYFRVLNCSIQFGTGKKQKGRQGEVKLGRSPCSIPLQGSFITPEASVRKR